MKLKKLNSEGFSHDIILVMVVVLVAIVGVAHLVGSHADQIDNQTNSAGATSLKKWSGWQSIGAGNTIQTPAVTATPESNSTGTLFQDTWNGTAWSGEHNIDGLIKNPGVVTVGNDTDIFGGYIESGAANGELVEKTSVNSGNWSNWQQVPQGTSQFSPALTAFNSTQFGIYAVGCDGIPIKGGNLCQNVWDGTAWEGWQNIGGDSLSGPAVATDSSGTSYLFIRGTGNAVYENISSGGKGWQGWQSIGGDTTATPAVVTVGSKKVYVFTRGSDNSNYMNYWDGSSWSGWQSLGGTDLIPPVTGDNQPPLPGLAATVYGKNKIAVYSIGANGQVYQDEQK
jgi:hypothetical protein